MIFVDGLPFSTDSSASPQGWDTLVALLEHPALVEASNSFKAISERRFSVREESVLDTSPRSKWVYLFQREYATVDPALVDHGNYNTGSESQENLDGYSFPLGAKIVETLRKRPEKFHIRTLCILGHNTRRDPEGNAYPSFNGFMIGTSTGSITPAIFDKTSRCPDEVVRRIRVSVSYEDTSWKGKLLETYDTQTDHFKIAPCCWTLQQLHFALSLQRYSDSEILLMCSTSPSAENPDFVENMRRQWDYLIKHPDWRETFPMKQPRIFERTAEGGWRKPQGADTLMNRRF
ncbi:protein N-terminal asparagine amidohydrolase isoform X2 [Pyrus communis]|uniref:protein N-terminal asparagine amidohydrolase isoform X2 n=1 Tax=Pyrus communis TaxID=23211 RepID=UPI0035C1A322